MVAVKIEFTGHRAEYIRRAVGKVLKGCGMRYVATNTWEGQNLPGDEDFAHLLRIFDNPVNEIPSVKNLNLGDIHKLEITLSRPTRYRNPFSQPKVARSASGGGV